MYHIFPHYLINVEVFAKVKKVKESRNKPGVPQRVPGGLGSQTS
jgi:hypothetical protein